MPVFYLVQALTVYSTFYKIVTEKRFHKTVTVKKFYKIVTMFYFFVACNLVEIGRRPPVNNFPIDEDGVKQDI